MRLSRTTVLSVTAGAFIIASAGLGMVRSQQVDEQNHLSERLAQTQANLGRVNPEQLSSRQAELESQLSQATLQFEAVKAGFSQAMGNVDITGVLFAIAKTDGVEITEISSSQSSENLEGVTCSAVSLTVNVEGDVPSMVGFIIEVNGFFPTGVVRSVTITVPGATGEGKASANFQLVVYYYQD